MTKAGKALIEAYTQNVQAILSAPGLIQKVQAADREELIEAIVSMNGGEPDPDDADEVEAYSASMEILKGARREVVVSQVLKGVLAQTGLPLPYLPVALRIVDVPGLDPDLVAVQVQLPPALVEQADKLAEGFQQFSEMLDLISADDRGIRH